MAAGEVGGELGLADAAQPVEDKDLASVTLLGPWQKTFLKLFRVGWSVDEVIGLGYTLKRECHPVRTMI